MQVAEAVQITELATALAHERERNRRLEALLRNLADHDPLTDLLNRRSLEHELEDHLVRCTRYGSEGALLLISLAGLDEVDRSGRSTSDEVLAHVAELVVSRLPTTDVVGRWGPRELAVLLPRASVAEVAVVADALTRIVAGASVPAVPAGSVAASIGVGLVVAGPLRAGDLVGQAVRALANAQRRGGGWATGGGGQQGPAR